MIAGAVGANALENRHDKYVYPPAASTEGFRLTGSIVFIGKKIRRNTNIPTTGWRTVRPMVGAPDIMVGRTGAVRRRSGACIPAVVGVRRMGSIIRNIIVMVAGVGVGGRGAARAVVAIR